jgi:DNA-binding Lrp family transcriptional regulator
MYKLDKIDKKILIIMSENPRISYTDLGKLIGLTKNTAKYRLDKLLDQVIYQVAPVINYKKLKLSEYAIFLKCDLTSAKKIKFNKWIIKHKKTHWVMDLFGNWDYYIEFICNDVFEFDQVIQEMVQFLGNSFQDFKTYIYTEHLKNQELLQELTSDVDFKYNFKWKKTNTKSTQIDNIDKKILFFLCKNGRMPYYEISEKIGVTLPTVINRINKMLDENIIMRFGSYMHFARMGYSKNLIIIKMNHYSLAQKQQLKKWFVNEMHTKLVTRVANTNELITYVSFQTTRALEEYIKDLRKNFSSIIKDVTILRIVDEIKLDFFPKGLI